MSYIGRGRSHQVYPAIPHGEFPIHPDQFPRQRKDKLFIALQCHQRRHTIFPCIQYSLTIFICQKRFSQGVAQLHRMGMKLRPGLVINCRRSRHPLELHKREAEFSAPFPRHVNQSLCSSRFDPPLLALLRSKRDFEVNLLTGWLWRNLFHQMADQLWYFCVIFQQYWLDLPFCQEFSIPFWYFLPVVFRYHRTGWHQHRPLARSQPSQPVQQTRICHAAPEENNTVLSQKAFQVCLQEGITLTECFIALASQHGTLKLRNVAVYLI